ncbi:hypothetical protein DAPPUDRAFT_113255 [Daphnia pulex]|uniref:Uncharacterized protein n=1 Tax=Daphnia pulex TaxID=6669 RepID=E9HEH5_DAPPU|nr:hypothetical protein DAPPUDRAFT_113255 [Daphnia pulex]|eukprot:EFX69877.1 hypothetical protein DAPPUDRAFT_113255 [Daphnia pulex]
MGKLRLLATTGRAQPQPPVGPLCACPAWLDLQDCTGQSPTTGFLGIAAKSGGQATDAVEHATRKKAVSHGQHQASGRATVVTCKNCRRLFDGNRSVLPSEKRTRKQKIVRRSQLCDIFKVWAGCPLQHLVYGVQSCLGLAGPGWKNAAVHFFGTSMIDGSPHLLSPRLSNVFSVYKVYEIHKTGTVRPSSTLLSTRMPFAPWPSGVSLSCAICPRIKYITTPPEPSLGTNKQNKQIERLFHEYSQWETDFSNTLGQIGDNCISNEYK